MNDRGDSFKLKKEGETEGSSLRAISSAIHNRKEKPWTEDMESVEEIVTLITIDNEVTIWEMDWF